MNKELVNEIRMQLDNYERVYNLEPNIIILSNDLLTKLKTTHVYLMQNVNWGNGIEGHEIFNIDIKTVKGEEVLKVGFVE